MLLQTLPFFGNSWCKDCPLIKRFMKGVYFQRKPKPRYLYTWDVSCVLKYLSSLFPLHKLSLKLLTFKVVALIALATAPRAQTLVSMDLDYMLIKENQVVFSFPDLLKTSREGHSFSLTLNHYKDEKLCVMHTLLFYLEKVQTKRLSKKVLVSYVTYKEVCTSTVARWLKSILELSGIDTKVFKAHSYRAASTSAAFNRGCSLKTILSTADWSSDKNFKKFYCRESVKSNHMSFADAVFQK
ncbi:MAG: tyrosine-type recombinase/integrase [Candidatus Thiodiazotropha taylori]|nr:tyrosine-type recombinase/integrase [Candidatus Thiodiazotropha taylori]MCW4264496.1 tyrosine-type recombinase/integrase [Candidatus Thiodiazotropha endolucinida]MCG8032055.1 tyrosine-type recombinase/integrase [Candidatus Thiodiazotropha taylori]MCG8046884.1 tyrosine-type recombinase/integrase [Candidatus Thiodiazotropha taylori]MCG8110905.1 tyrosine-type recombinase/integrase [Candidatus Thiodiazotropha taylori]